MWVVYSVNCKTCQVKLLCYTTEYESAIDAVDQYAIAGFMHKERNWEAPKSEEKGEYITPMDDTTPLGSKDGYFLRMDQSSANQEGDYVRVDLFKVTQGLSKLLRYWKFDKVDKYIEDYLAERTATVIQMESDEIVNIASLNLTGVERAQGDSDEEDDAADDGGESEKDSDED